MKCEADQSDQHVQYPTKQVASYGYHLHKQQQIPSDRQKIAFQPITKDTTTVASDGKSRFPESNVETKQHKNVPTAKQEEVQYKMYSKQRPQEQFRNVMSPATPPSTDNVQGSR
jgi:hypothetical protein